MVIRQPEGRLRAVGDRHGPRRSQPRSLKAAIKLPERDLLAALRQRVAVEIDAGPPPHTLAGLVRQLRDLDKEIRLLDVRLEEELRLMDRERVSGDRTWAPTAI